MGIYLIRGGIIFATLITLMGVSCRLFAQNAPEGPTITRLQTDIAAGRSSAQTEFWDLVTRRGSPLIEDVPGDRDHVLATFVWKEDGDTKRVTLDARVNGDDPFDDPLNSMKRVKGTDVWFLTCRLPSDAEFIYQFFINVPESQPLTAALQRQARPDPLNATTYPDRFDPLFDASQAWRNASIAIMPAAPANPWLAKRNGIAHGTLREDSIKSVNLTLANPRNVWVYRTPGADNPNPNILVVMDGGTTYQDRIPTTTILDNLYAEHKIGPTIAVFVDNGGQARNQDMNFSDAFVKFLADELMPWVRGECKCKTAASRTVTVGDSIAGLIGAYAAMRRPDVFGKVIAQSGAFQFNNSRDKDDTQVEWIVRQFAKLPKSDISFYLDVGLMENRAGGGTTLLGANRNLRDALKAKGYPVSYSEVYSDHDPVHWRRTLPDALIAMLAR